MRSDQKTVFDKYLSGRARRDKIRTPAGFSARVDDTLRSLSGGAEARSVAVPVRRLGRRAMAALVAAAILLVTATALAAVYFSRMQKFKDETQAVLDASYVEWMPTNIQPNGLKTNVAGIELSINWFYYQDSDEAGGSKQFIVQYVAYSPTDPGAMERSDFCMTVNSGEAIPTAYNDPEAFEKQTDPSEGYKAYISAAYAVAANPLTEGNTLLFTGKIAGEDYAMTYTLDTETMAQLKSEVEAEYAQSSAVLEAIPQEAAEVELSFMGYTIKEVAVKDGFMYFTQQNIPEYWEAHEGGRETSPEEAALGAEGIYAGIDVFPFIDGCPMLHEALGNVDQVYPDGYVYRTYIGRSRDKLPARSLISFTGIVFYYEWATDTVIAPADEAEQKEWRQTNMELVRQNAAKDAWFSFSAETDAFTATDLIFNNRLWGTIGLALNTPDAYEGARGDVPVVTIDGTKLEYLGDSKFHIDEWPGGSQRGNQRHGYNYVGIAAADLGESFEVTVEWRGEKTSFTLKGASAVTENIPYTEYKTIFGY